MCFLLFACGGDDRRSVSNEEKIDENRAITVTSSDLFIAESQVEQGSLPVTNGELLMDDLPEKVSAVQNIGFSIELSSSSSFIGAYIQVEGNDEYYDVNLNSHNSFFSKSDTTIDNLGFDENNIAYDNSLRKDRHPKISLTKITNNFLEVANDVTELRIDFPNNLEPGTFKFDISIYDDTGNISAPQTVCVVVEAWGGNANFVGNWQYDKAIYEDGEMKKLEEEYCYVYDEEICDKDCFSYTQYSYNIQSDGSFSITKKYTKTSYFTCVPDDIEINSVEMIGRGNWYYSEIDKKLMGVYTYKEDVNNDVKTVKDYQSEGEFSSFEFPVNSVSSSELVLTEYNEFDELIHFHLKK